jgi:hypothetical protein
MKHIKFIWIAGVLSAVLLLGGLYWGVSSTPITVSSPEVQTTKENQTISAEPVVIPAKQHIQTPVAVRAIYMTSWVASQKDWRRRLAEFVRDSDLNSIIIDVKDYSGVIAFKTGDPVLAASGAEQVRVPDMEAFIAELHEMGIYVIARISVFQDPIFAAKYPSEAVQTSSGAVWADRHGLHFVDPASKAYWDYLFRLSKASIAIGFDELNFDYVRYPTDGNLKDIRYPLSDLKTVEASLREKRPTSSVLPTAKQVVLTRFFKALSEELKPSGIPLSVDLFGMVLTARDDVSIGQVLESALPYFDYICPMVYPSHYPPHFNGYANPAQHPYEIIHFVMKAGADRVKAAGYSPNVLRPWLQDFNLGAKYDESKVRAQIKATHDAGLNSWLIWDPRNRYTKSAYTGWEAATPNAIPQESL